MKDTALVMKISRGSLSDGEGIRTVVFLKGCNLQCRWCHNPEGISPCRQVMIYPEKCIKCGKCQQRAPGEFVIEGTAARHIGEVTENALLCAEQCPKSAIEISGAQMTPRQVFDEIVRDKVFYDKSKGGVTFSGGECLLNVAYLREVLILCKEEGISVALETAMNVDFDSILPVVELVDTFIVDLKHMDNEKHMYYTGCENTRILSNAKRLFALHPDILFRVPLIPAVNDSLENLVDTVSFVSSLTGGGQKRIELLKYNDLARSKYDALLMPFTKFGIPQTRSEMDDLCRILAQHTNGVEIFHN